MPVGRETRRRAYHRGSGTPGVSEIAGASRKAARLSCPMDRPESSPAPGQPPAPSIEQELEEARIGHGIPTVRPLGEDELPARPPSRELFRQGMLEGLRELWRYR